MSDVSICHYRLSRVEYDRAVEAGVFEADAKLELIDGDLHAMTPEGSRHSLGIDLAADCLREVFGPGFYVRIQHPLATDDYSEPEPDVAIVTGPMRDYRDAHPTSAVLVVEVSNESGVPQHVMPRWTAAGQRGRRGSRLSGPAPATSTASLSRARRQSSASG